MPIFGCIILSAMLKSLRELGKLIGRPTLYDPMEADKVFVLEFDGDGNYIGLTQEQFQRSKVPLYFYRKWASRTPSHTLTIYLNKNEPHRSTGNLKAIYNALRSVSEDIPYLDISNKRILTDIRNYLKNAKGDKIIITVRINGKFMGEIDVFQKVLEKKLRSARNKKNGSKWIEGICSICGERKKVNGDISPFKFYTIDKPGYVIGFNKKYAYKSFPLCHDCRELIRHGRQHVERNLTFAFAGEMKYEIKYSIIPDFVLGHESVRGEVLAILTEGKKSASLKGESIRRITADEEEILEILSEERDVMSFHFLFMEKKGSSSQERINLYLQDVYPSRLKSLFKAKSVVESLLSLESEFTYGTMWKFFATKNSADYFYEVIYRTFTGRPIDRGWLISRLMGKIREGIVESQTPRLTILDAFATFVFVLLTTKKEGVMDVRDSAYASLEEFLDTLPALDTPLKKGLFLMGALTEKLIRVQRRVRGSTPFYKVLKSLKMDERDLKGLLPRIRNKLEEYDHFRKGESILYAKASEYLSQAPSPWGMNVDELNFYFALGMGMYNHVAELIYGKEEVEDDLEEQA